LVNLFELRYWVYHFDTVHRSLPHYVKKFFIRYVFYVSYCMWCTDIVRLLLYEYSTLLFAVFYTFGISQCFVWFYFFLFAGT